MIASSYVDIGKLPLSSTRLNFISKTEPFQHSINFCVRPKQSDTEAISSKNNRNIGNVHLTLQDGHGVEEEVLPIVQVTKVIPTTNKEVLINSNSASIKSQISNTTDSFDHSMSPVVSSDKSTIKTVVFDPFKSNTVSEHHSLSVNCMITESLQSVEKSQVTEKFDLSGATFASLVGDRSALSFHPQNSKLGLSFQIADNHSNVGNIISANKAVHITLPESNTAQSHTVQTTIACSDILAVLSSAGSSPSSSLPPIPVLRYSVVNTFRPMIMRTRTVLSMVSDSEEFVTVKIQVHVLMNGRVITNRFVKDMVIQVSCAPLLALAGSSAATPVSIRNVVIGSVSTGRPSSSGPQSGYNVATKVVTWVCGDADIRQASTVSVDATVEIPKSASSPLLDQSAVASTHLPTIVKALCEDMLLSGAEVVCAPHSGESGVTTEVVATKRQTRLECRFL